MSQSGPFLSTSIMQNSDSEGLSPSPPSSLSPWTLPYSLALSPIRYWSEDYDSGLGLGTSPGPSVQSVPAQVYDPLMDFINFGSQYPIPIKPTDTSSEATGSSRTTPSPRAKVFLNIGSAGTNDYTTIEDDSKPMGRIENRDEEQRPEIKDLSSLIDHDHDYYKKPRGWGPESGIDEDGTKYYNPEFVLFWGLKKNGPNPERPFACPVPDCTKSYNHRNGMKYHAKYSHTAPQRFDCSLCRKSYSTRIGLLQHHKFEHNPSHSKKRGIKKPIPKPIFITKQRLDSQSKANVPVIPVSKVNKSLGQQKFEDDDEVMIIERADPSNKIQKEKPIPKPIFIIKQQDLDSQSKVPVPVVQVPKVDQSPNQQELEDDDDDEIMFFEKTDSSKYYNYEENDNELVIDIDY